MYSVNVMRHDNPREVRAHMAIGLIRWLVSSKVLVYFFVISGIIGGMGDNIRASSH